MQVILNGQTISILEISHVAHCTASVQLDDAAAKRINHSRAVVEQCVSQELVRYGITTGFGKFSDVVINKEDNARLQKNLIITHAVGVGNPLPDQAVRAMMCLRINALAVGNSGIRLSTVLALIDLLNKNIIPIVPEKGSLGSSGDLAPLSHMVLPLIGLGECRYNGIRMSGAQALQKAGLQPVELAAKEGLALINGTQCMTGIACLAAVDSVQLFHLAHISGALTFQALGGITDAFDERIHSARGQAGQIKSAQILRALLKDSGCTTRQGEKRVQDAYALRCMPQVHGASGDAIQYVSSIVQAEVNAATDNPLIFSNPEDKAGGDIISGGNFHGQPVALAMDFLAIAVSELANIAERRLERLVNPALSNGLPAFLVKEGGLNSGFMIVQYTAASLVSENKVLAHPASVDSIPSSANQEDHVSMGTIAARKAAEIIKNTRSVLALELMAACQAIDLCETADRLSPITKTVYDRVRSKIPMLDQDRPLKEDIDVLTTLLADTDIIEQTQQQLSIKGIVYP